MASDFTIVTGGSQCNVFQLKKIEHENVGLIFEGDSNLKDRRLDSQEAAGAEHLVSLDLTSCSSLI